MAGQTSIVWNRHNGHSLWKPDAQHRKEARVLPLQVGLGWYRALIALGI